jgi:acetolactate synthase-1/2/3 large subunit
MRLPKDEALIASGSGPGSAGWLFAIDGDTPETIDHIHTFGLTMVGGRLYRVLCSEPQEGAPGEILSYDQSGIRTYHRIDGLADPHGAAWDGQHLIVPCSGTNEILWVTPAGEIARRWRAPGENDSWHLNGVFIHQGNVCLSAFGRFDTNAGLIVKMRTPVGVVFDLESGRDLVTGLSCPHDPIFLDGAWIICNSAEYELVEVEPATNRRLRSVALGGWTRGVAVTEEAIYVGVSAERHAGDAGHASIVMIDRRSWQILDRMELPSQEIQSLCLAPTSLVPSLRRGFRTNSYRVGAQDREDLLASAGNLRGELAMTPMSELDPLNRQIAARATAPPIVEAGKAFEVTFEFLNLGRKTLLSARPNPISIGCRLGKPGDPSSFVDYARSVLLEPVPPGCWHTSGVELNGPKEAGSYEVVFTLLQEWVAWFDHDDGRNAVSVRFEVGTPELQSTAVVYRSLEYKRRIFSAWLKKVWSTIFSDPFSPIS